MQKTHNKLLQKLKTKKAVIWDFDGVFCFMNWSFGEDLNLYKNKIWKLLEEFDPTIKTKFIQGLKYPYEHTDYIISKYGKNALKRINEFYLKKELQLLPASPLNEQLINLVNNLHPTIEHYIWSNNQEEFILKKLKTVRIINKFKKIISRDKVTLAKPNLEGFEMIRSTSNIPISEFLLVGDSLETDKIAADKLGIEFFHYLNTNEKSYI